MKEEREILLYSSSWGIDVLMNYLIFESVKKTWGKDGTQLFSFSSIPIISPLKFFHWSILCILILMDSSFQMSIQVISGTICEEEIGSLKLLSIHSVQVCFLLVKSVALCLLPAFIASCLFTVVGWVDLIIIEVRLSASVDTIWSMCWKHHLKAIPYVCYTILEKSRCFMLG